MEQKGDTGLTANDGEKEDFVEYFILNMIKLIKEHARYKICITGEPC